MRFRVRLAAAATAIALVPASPASAQGADRTVADRIYTTAQAERGRVQYQAQCARCHSGNLHGSDSAPSLAGIQFVDNWRGQTVAALSRRVRDTMPLDNPGSLDRATVADILAYLLSANRFPAGAAELPSGTQPQQQIRIEFSVSKE